MGNTATGITDGWWQDLRARGYLGSEKSRGEVRTDSCITDLRTCIINNSLKVDKAAIQFAMLVHFENDTYCHWRILSEETHHGGIAES